MANQKLENLLELALEIGDEQRERSEQLNVGFSEEDRTWELIVKYNGDIERLQSNVIRVERLIAGYAIVTLPEALIETFTGLDEVEYVEK
ncbi:MAG: peptidase S8, partial [Lachnospiraceae bacterium]|nr:peptidase S8 [Lachnospiraceae bacterium]